MGFKRCRKKAKACEAVAPARNVKKKVMKHLKLLLLWALVVWRQQEKKTQVKSSSLFLSLEVDKTRLLRSSSDWRICGLSVAVRSRWTWKVPFTGRDSANSLSHSSGFISSGRAGVGARSPFWSRQKPSEHQTVDVCKSTVFRKAV